MKEAIIDYTKGVLLMAVGFIIAAFPIALCFKAVDSLWTDLKYVVKNYDLRCQLEASEDEIRDLRKENLWLTAELKATRLLPNADRLYKVASAIPEFAYEGLEGFVVYAECIDDKGLSWKLVKKPVIKDWSEHL